MKILYKPNY